MSDAVLTALKLCFLLLVYLFLARVVQVVLREMRVPVPVPALEGGGGAATAPAPSRSRRRRGAAVQLRVLEPAEHRGEVFVLTDEMTVGRGGGCGIVLADDTFVSQVHARVFLRDGDYVVEDLGSRNGTLVNGQPVDEPTPIRPGDRVQFGSTVTEALR